MELAIYGLIEFIENTIVPLTLIEYLCQGTTSLWRSLAARCGLPLPKNVRRWLKIFSAHTRKRWNVALGPIFFGVLQINIITSEYCIPAPGFTPGGALSANCHVVTSLRTVFAHLHAPRAAISLIRTKPGSAVRDLTTYVALCYSYVLHIRTTMEHCLRTGCRERKVRDITT